MDVEEYTRVADAEDDHWWYRSTRALMAEYLAPWLGEGQAILDAGCGPGGNGAWLSRHGRVVGLDLAPEALGFVRVRHPRTTPVRGNVTHLPFDEASFDIVLAVTVLCSVPDDASAMGELARVVRPGGAVLVIEPAFQVLRRRHDVTVHSLRRYRLGQLAHLAESAGLRVRRASYAYSFLLLPAVSLALAHRARPGHASATVSDVERRRLDRVFERLARGERRLLARHRVPFGTSAILVATAR